ncbi:NHL repeat-containing protein [Paenibacillus sp. J5C_2022]|uniref:NHL repeat-containing protein n=1 Tax=Paenibacillus sp. J5C2022 TaxID=2977129 RepID=UPI0021D1C852|nr:NHL repeat-containing protein [Paenibacillus sp. J5C2022]MCU6708846.1 NHL repeat-containing protein [Paenibacillus sp. J5C2022]
MRKLHFKWLAVTITIACLLLSGRATVWAEEPYRTYTQDSYNRLVPTQPAYRSAGLMAQNIYVNDDEGASVYSPLKRPQDLFIDKLDEIYIADTENNRIVHLDAKGDLLRALTVPDSPLNRPQGVFVTDNGDLYIADTGNRRVVRLDKEGRLLHEYTKPESRLVPDTFVYEPSKVSVDKRGFIYVVPRGSYQGIVQFDPEGKFYGFFGTNWTEATLMDRLKRMIFTQEQLSRQVRLLPAAIGNLFIDEQSYLYTVSVSETEQIKKLNIRGDNLWRALSFGGGFIHTDTPDATMTDTLQFADITVDRSGAMTAIEKTENVIYQYDASGKLLFFWSGPATAGMPRVGLQQSPVSIATNSKNELFVLDDSLNGIQKFTPTPFGERVYRAFGLMHEGKYSDSVPEWQEIIRLNAHFTPAYHGLADAAYYAGDYREALRLYRVAGSGEGYSDAFWQLRLQWFQNHFSFVATWVLVLAVAWMLATRLQLSWWRGRAAHRGIDWSRYRLIGQLRHGFTILRSPIDGFGDLRYLNKGGYQSAALLLLLSVLSTLGSIYVTSFSFDPVSPGSRNGGTVVLVGAGTWLSWIVCNYLIGSIRHGEARFKDVFVGGAYALFPLLLFSLPLALASNGMTLSEAPIYGFLQSAIYVWCGLLYFWNIQALQNYTVGEAVVNVLLTAFATVILWVLLFILAGLFSEFAGFIQTIYLEVSM